MNTLSATYSPEDNKLRLSSLYRLDTETYKRVREAGFIYAPKQQVFVAPMWTPDREDLLLELCGEIGDEDTSLTERAEERAERFTTYQEKRAEDAERAYNAVSAIADGIPMGQPILVGHHSQRRAERDAEKIKSGMQKAVNMWRTSEYWERRAKGALTHAKYKELPGVRARRIKGLEADLRKQEREKQKAQACLDLWNKEDLTQEVAVLIASRTEAGHLSLPRKEGDREDFDLRPSAYCALTNAHPSLYAPRTLEEVIETANSVYPRIMARCDRWIEHFTLRITYEKMMLAEAGESDLLKPKEKPKQLPLCNYRQDTIFIPRMYGRKGEEEELPQIEMTSAEYAKIYSEYKGTRVVENSHRVRICVKVTAGRMQYFCVFLTDSKVHTKPEPVSLRLPQPEEFPQRPYNPPVKTEQDLKFEALQQTLKEGVATVAAPQLFPTPKELAERMIEIAGIEEGMTVLEPSAGTGNILDALPKNMLLHVDAVEINYNLARLLEKKGYEAVQADFLEVERGRFCPESAEGWDRILMNPPFENGADIRHIEHARGMLKAGGRLVAICANGPRQRKRLLPLAEESGGYWEDLPAGSFAVSGTHVNTALLVIEG